MSTVTATTGSAVIADRFRLDVPADNGPATVNAKAAAVACVCAIAAAAMLGFTAWLLYQNWELIQGV